MKTRKKKSRPKSPVVSAPCPAPRDLHVFRVVLKGKEVPYNSLTEVGLAETFEGACSIALKAHYGSNVISVEWLGKAWARP